MYYCPLSCGIEHHRRVVLFFGKSQLGSTFPHVSPITLAPRILAPPLRDLLNTTIMRHDLAEYKRLSHSTLLILLYKVNTHIYTGNKYNQTCRGCIAIYNELHQSISRDSITKNGATRLFKTQKRQKNKNPRLQYNFNGRRSLYAVAHFVIRKPLLYFYNLAARRHTDAHNTHGDRPTIPFCICASRRLSMVVLARLTHLLCFSPALSLTVYTTSRGRCGI